MGQSKLLLPWGKGTVLERLVGQWQVLNISQVGVVVAKGDEAMCRELDRLKIENRILNPQPDQGMFSSIKCAANWKGWDANTTHWVLSLGDQPQVCTSTLERLLVLAANSPNKICQPSREGCPRHPVIFPRGVFMELRRSSAVHLKSFLAGREGDRLFSPSADEGLDIDLDTPEDYRMAVEQFPID